MNQSRTIPIAIILGGIIIAISVYFSIPKAPHTTSGNPSLVRPVSSNDHILGNPAAKVVVVEYSDFDCDFCKGFDNTMHQVIASEGMNGDVAWVYREFPLIEIHPNAFKNAEAAECAAQTGGNDAFWKFKDEMFKRQPVDPKDYGTIAKNIGLPGEAFATCFADAANTVDASIRADRKNALDVGAEGTPYSLILVPGKTPIVMNGGYSYEAVKAVLDQVLEKTAS